jgi:hypothetical protein
MIGFIGLFDTARHYTSQFTVTHPRTHTRSCLHSHVFTRRCSVAAYNGGHFPSSGCPNSPRPQLRASKSSSSHDWTSVVLSVTRQPTNSTNWTRPSLTGLLVTSRHGPHRKHRCSVAVYGPLPSKGRGLVVYGRCLAAGLHATVLNTYATETLTRISGKN